MAGGLGRALGGYDEMVFRAMVRDRSYIYDFVGLESEGTTTDFQVGANSYLYGTRFMSFLAYQYGPEKLLEWVRQSDKSKLYFASQFRQVFGRSLDDEWSRWIRFEHEWQNTLPAKERLHLGFNYHHWQWKVSGYYNNADFYDLFGPTKYARKGYALRVEHSRNLLFKPPRRMDLEWGIAGYGGLDRLPEYQNVATSFDKFLTGKVALNYSYLEKSLGAVDDEKGLKWQAASRVNYVNSKLYPRIYGNFDYGFLLPLNNSAVWIRSSAGRSFGRRSEPFANFYFGGFGNNWVDKREVSRYRQYYSFPGVELNQIGATDYARSLVQWNLPPLKFRRFGLPYLYCNWSRLSLFSSGIIANIASATDSQRLRERRCSAGFPHRSLFVPQLHLLRGLRRRRGERREGIPRAYDLSKTAMKAPLPDAFSFVSFAISILPVFAFLLLVFLDSYKLVPLGHLLLTILRGAAIALICLGINTAGFWLAGHRRYYYSGFFVPVIEEVLKALYIYRLVQGDRIGFMVDGAINGFGRTGKLALSPLLASSARDIWQLRSLGYK